MLWLRDRVDYGDLRDGDDVLHMAVEMGVCVSDGKNGDLKEVDES